MRLKVISTGLSPYHRSEAISKIVEILRKEHEKHPSIPILMVLSEKDPITVPSWYRDGISLYQDEDGKVKAGEKIKDAIERLKKAAKDYNAHILFAGPEKVSFKTEPELPSLKQQKSAMVSAFVVNPEGVAIVRRKLFYDKKVSRISLKTINIEGFNVLPLICWEFLSYKIKDELKSKRIKAPDIIAVPAESFVSDKEKSEPKEYLSGLRKLREIGYIGDKSLVVISNSLGGKKHDAKLYAIGHDKKPKFFEKPHRYSAHIIEK